MKKIILLSVLMLFPLNAFAQNYPLMGIGISKCSAYNNMTKDDPGHIIKNTYFGWIQGFLSGMNEVTLLSKKFAVDLNSPSFDFVTQQGFLDSMCRRYPDETVVEQAFKMYSEMIKLGLKKIIEKP